MNRLNKKAKAVFLIFTAFLVIFLALTITIRLDSPIFEKDYSAVVLDENGEYLRIFLNSEDMWYFPPDSLDIPDKLKECVIFFEDKRFYGHPGIDFIAFARAIAQNIKAKRYVSGASTISMQVIRLSGKRNRTILSKLIEMFLAIKLELKYSKDEIMKLYLNNAPYGGNIIGYRAAVMRYYSKMPDELTWAEAAMLAVLPNSPSLINPDSNMEALLKKRNNLLKRLSEEGIIDDETYSLSILENIPDGQIPFEIYAPHFSRDVANRQKGIIHTTINKRIQKNSETIIRQYSDELIDYGVKNFCAIIVETETREIKGYVGSQDFFNTRLNGMVDGVKAERSYGSVLKPFLYALAIDKGLIVPETKLKDIPTFYGSFSPYNADLGFSGMVTSHDALIRSLNVPAVRLLYTYDFHNYYDFLKAAGITALRENADHYGLTIILGGAESSPYDIAKLYCGLGNLGNFHDLVYIKNVTDGHHPQALLSPASCLLTLDIMKDVHRPGAEFYHEMFSNQWEMAWKTGTSYGQRDAWAAGVTPQWTIVVWAGNFTGEENTLLMGARTAGPLLFRLFNSLPKEIDKAWFELPEIYFEDVAICLHTGYRAGENCTDTVHTIKPRNEYPLKECPYHKKLFLNSDSTMQLCSKCWGNLDVIETSWLVYPPEVAQFLRKKGQKYNSLPPHKPNCPVSGSGNYIDFIYPKSGQNIFLPKGITGEFQKIIFKAGHVRDNAELYWYIDDIFKGSTFEGSRNKSHSIAVQVKPGDHMLSITDEEGITESIDFHIVKSRKHITSRD